MSDKLTTIRIETGLLGGETPVGVNGAIRHIPHDRDFGVTDDELRALRDSNIQFTIVDGAASLAPEATGGAEGGLSASPEPAKAPRKRRAKPAAPAPTAETKPAAKKRRKH